jgi:hypothetical protein
MCFPLPSTTILDSFESQSLVSEDPVFVLAVLLRAS